MGGLTLGVPASAPANDCGAWLYRLFGGETPSSITWTRRVDEACRVIRQGGLGSCWTHGAHEVLTPYLRRHGVIGPQDELSVDYYFAKRIESQLEAQRVPPFERYSHAGSFPDFYALVEQYGVVTRAQYRFPELARGVTFRSPAGQRRFARDAKKLGLAELKAKYFRLESVEPRPLAPHVFPEIEITQGADPALMETVRRELDSGRAVYGKFHLVDVGYRTLRYFGASGFDLKSIVPDALGGGHAMAIVGYRMGPSGQIDHLLIKNSYGKNFGEGGYAAVTPEFFRKYVHRIYALPEK